MHAAQLGDPFTDRCGNTGRRCSVVVQFVVVVIIPRPQGAAVRGITPECQTYQSGRVPSSRRRAIDTIAATMRLLAMLCFSFLAPSQGTWEATAWRLTTNSPTGDMDGEWTIRELQLYATPDCSGTKIPKIPGDSGTIPSGANTIADGDTGTWWLGCNPCHPHKEYVGLRTALTVVRTKTRRPAVF